MTISITAHALHIFVFVPLLPGVGNPDRAVRKTWVAASKLGISQPLSDDFPVELPDELQTDDVWFRVLAAKTDADAQNTALVFIAHDVAAVAIRLHAPAIDAEDVGTDPWTSLSRTWRDVTGGDQLIGALGALHLFSGIGDQPVEVGQRVIVGAVDRRAHRSRRRSGVERMVLAYK